MISLIAFQQATNSSKFETLLRFMDIDEDMCVSLLEIKNTLINIEILFSLFHNPRITVKQ